MSHPISPNNYRFGKSYLWTNNSLLIQQNKSQLIDKANLSSSLMQNLNLILKRQGLLVVKNKP